MSIFRNAKIAIVGAGAVGSYYGAKLARGGCNVSFLMRRDYEHVKQHGLRILSHDGDFALPKVQVYRSTEEIGPCDLVIIALKATENHVLPQLIPPLLHANTTLLALQNGLGNVEFLADHFGAARVLGGTCFVCINRIAPGVTQNFGHGNVTLGEYIRPPQPRTRDLAALFEACGVPCRVVESVDDALWRKLVWNIPFNGLAIAANRADVSQILSDPALLQLTRKLMREVLAIARVNGVEIADDFMDSRIENTRNMGAYRPSSLIDFEAGKPVEVEAIWGEAYRRGVQVGVEAAHLETLYCLLQWLTRRCHENSTS